MTRPYQQRRRAQTAAATRARILAAARRQILSGEPFVIQAVARRAGVSRVTVYSQFGDGDRLREAVFDEIAETGGLRQIPTIFAAADVLEGIDRLIEIFCRFYSTHRAVLRRLNALAALSAGAGNRPPGRNRRRGHILLVLLRRLSAMDAYQGLDVEATATVLQALTSFEFFDQLASSRPQEEPAAAIRRLLRLLVGAKRQVPGVP